MSDTPGTPGKGEEANGLGDTLLSLRPTEDPNAPSLAVLEPARSALPALPMVASLAGRYVLLNELGQGAMGTVHAAYDTRLDRRVALKLLHPQEQEMWAQLREPQAMARLSHPNVVAVYDAGTLEENTVFISMELVEGQTLRQWSQERERPWREVLAMYLGAARGLAAAHAAGLVHRDFKPENVLVGRDGRARVTDFGLARVGAPAAMGTPVEATWAPARGPFESERGWLMGTPAYMAPEVLSGQSADTRSDLFAFCVALYETLYGQPAFPGTTLSERWSAQRLGHVNPPPASSAVPAWVADILRQGLQADPGQRPASMQELIERLEDDPQARRRARWRAVARSLAVLFLVLVAFAGWTQHSGRQCQRLTRRLKGTWDAPLQEAVRQALLKTGLPYAQDTSERVRAALDGYAQEWLRLRIEVCEASGESVSPPRNLAMLQVSCLERRRAQLEDLVRLLARGPDEDMLPQAVRAVYALPPPGSCMDVQALTSTVPLPEEPEARARAAALQGQVDHLESLWGAGKFQEGLRLGAGLLPQVEALDHPPLRAQLLFHLGRLHGGAGDYVQADALLRQALVQAGRSRDDVLLARLWNMLIWNAEIRRAQHSSAWDTEELVLRTAVARAGDDLARAESLHTLGGVLYNMGHFEQAYARFQEALFLLEARQGEHPFVASMYNDLGVTLTELGRFEEARASYERALALFQKLLGPEHPEVANTLTSLGRSLVRTGHPDEAERWLQSSLVLGRKVLGARHPQIAETLLGLSEVALARGQPSLAVSSLEQALDITQPSERAETQFTLARALLDSHAQRERARRLATEALEYYHRIGNQPRADAVSRWLSEHPGASAPRH